MDMVKMGSFLAGFEKNITLHKQSLAKSLVCQIKLFQDGKRERICLLWKCWQSLANFTD